MVLDLVQTHLIPWIDQYGYWVLALVVGLESAGVPLPGETLLVSAAAYAAAVHRLDIFHVILAAATGAVIGDNLGYEIGRRLGYPALLRWGHLIGLGESRIRVARYLFAVHGPKVVFLGRFVAVLRMLAAALAGINRMPRLLFFIYNLAGGLVWAAAFGLGGYLAGEQIHRLGNWIGLLALVAAVIGLMIVWAGLHRREAAWSEAAQRYFAARTRQE